MASQTEIANMALTLLGDQRISVITENTKPARELNAVWDIRRDACLRASLWRFAMTRTTRSADETAPAWGFTYSYTIPSNWLRVVQVNDTFIGLDMTDYRTGETADFMIEGRNIYSNVAAPLKLRGVQRIEDTDVWDACFVAYFAADLAETACESITGSSQKRRDAAEAKSVALQEAVAANVLETPPRHFRDDSWLLSRLGW